MSLLLSLVTEDHLALGLECSLNVALVRVLPQFRERVVEHSLLLSLPLLARV